MKLGASTLGFRHDPLDVALEAIAVAGFDSVDIAAISSYCPHFDILGSSSADKNALARRLADLTLKVSTLNVGEGLLGDAGSQERAFSGYLAALELAQQLGCYAITIQSGLDPARTGTSWDEVADRVAPKLLALCEAAATRGIDLAVEIHKQKLVADSVSALALAERVRHPAFGYTLDPSHLIYAGEKPEESATRLGSLIRHVHLRDAVGKNIMVVPGDGNADFAALFRALAAAGYRRTCSIELEYEHARALQVAPDLKRATAYLTPLTHWAP